MLDITTNAAALIQGMAAGLVITFVLRWLLDDFAKIIITELDEISGV